MTENEPPAPDFGRGIDLNAAQQLACGADVDALLEQVADGHGDQLTVHQRGCVYCQAALAQFAQAWEPVAQAARVAFVVPAGVAAAITANVLAGIGTPQSPGPPGASWLRSRHAGRWLTMLAGLVVLAAIIIGIALANRHDKPNNSGLISTPTPTAGPARPTTAVAPPTRVSTASSNNIRTSLPAPTPGPGEPTAVPAGNGGRAAPTTSRTRTEQLALLAAGALLTAVGGTGLARRRRRLSR